MASLVFSVAPPTYAFQNVQFEAQVHLVDEHKTKVLGVDKSLRVTLRFHDTYDVVADQSMLTQETAQIDATDGSCTLRLCLNTLTASRDGRAFCIEVRSAEGDIESAFSTPINVIKEKLRIIQQPPEIWFKDEGGREKCMTVVLVLDAAPGATPEDRVVPLQVRLLYESGKPVVNQGILRLFPDMRPNMTQGRVTISFRIDDVSKNHQGQSFTLEVAPEKQDKSFMFQDIAPVRTSIIAIRSKRNKRKLQATRASPRSLRPHRLMNPMGTPMNSMANQYAMTPSAPSGRSAAMAQGSGMSWSNHVRGQVPTPMNSAPTPTNAGAAPSVVEWKLAGFEIHADGTQNVSRPIYRCPNCKRLNDVDLMNSGMLEHSSQCVFASIISSSSQQQQQPQQQFVSSTPRQAMTPMNQQPPTPQSNPMNPMMMSMSGAMAAPGMQSAPTQCSPKAASAAVGSAHRPVLTISPFMGKSTNGAPVSTDSQDTTTTTTDSNSGNLFASSAFRTQMELDDSSAMVKSPTLDEKIAFLNKLPDASTATETSGPVADAGIEATGNMIFNEMSSMGINIAMDSFDKDTNGGASTNLGGLMSPPDSLDNNNNLGFLVNEPLGGSSGAPGSNGSNSVDEDKVFHILARMYTNLRNQKLGLPAFDQFRNLLGFYVETQSPQGTEVVFHPLSSFVLSDKEQSEIATRFAQELDQSSDAVHSLQKHQHTIVRLREDALMFYWSQSIQTFGVMQ
ncbi:TPA: hypothetical protein N0F65_005810 [Lagenidium giganteum]|uniref:Uncharacterized protein n=1 Tax=Lagenidium giganteum TaxID=4803 RepID=A0AAV2YQY2_9STRA|nr:TPA: hypothetical protein N0F65_005810 [Lagenidium giganteum]